MIASFIANQMFTFIILRSIKNRGIKVYAQDPFICNRRAKSVAQKYKKRKVRSVRYL